MTITCNKCGIVNGFIEEKGTQVGLYCNKCGKWIKWLTKDDARLFKHNETQMLNENRQAGYSNGYAVGYREAIEKNKKEIKDLIIDLSVIKFKDIDEIAEHLKAGGNP